NPDEHVRQAVGVARLRDREADAFRRGVELADDDADETASDRDPRRRGEIGKRAGQNDLEVKIFFAAAEGAHDADEQRIGGFHAGEDVENERKDREQKNQHRLAGEPDAEKDDEERRDRDERARVERREKRVKRVFHAPLPAHDDAEWYADDDGSREAQDERAAAHAEVMPQPAGRDLIAEGGGDERRFGEEK